MALKRSKRLAPVLELADRELQQSASRLGALQQQLDGERQKLQQLEDYSQDTLNLIEANRHTNVDTLMRQRGFVERMGQACRQQSQAIAQIQKMADDALQQWQLKSQKLEKLGELVERYRQEEQQQVDKQEQAMLDDLSSLRFRKR